MPLDKYLQVRLYDNNLSSPTLIAELTERITNLQFGTQLNGGFKLCTFYISMSIAEAWNWLSREGKRGYHFSRVTVHEGRTLIWEGRVFEIGLNVRGTAQGIQVTCQGYWAATQDQFYTATGNTDWASGSGHEIDDIIKEMLTGECPDISSDQSNITAGSRDLVGLDFTTKEYPQTRINQLTQLSDDDNGVWFFAIWDDRIPYLFKRSVTEVNWYVWLSDVGNLDLAQSASDLRNAVLPFVGTTEGTTQTDTTSLALYPRREIKITLPTGANANSQGDAATSQVTERALPRQSNSFVLSGSVYKTAGNTGGMLEKTPLWHIRAGDVIRIQDLVPSTAASPELDDLRTFYVVETQYNASQDTITIQPDRPKRTLSRMLNRIGDVQR
jgi:hypothetical protein